MAKHRGAGQRPKHGVTGGMRANMAARDANEAVLRRRIQDQAAARQSQTKPVGSDPDTKPVPKPGPKPKGE